MTFGICIRAAFNANKLHWTFPGIDFFVVRYKREVYFFADCVGFYFFTNILREERLPIYAKFSNAK